MVQLINIAKVIKSCDRKCKILKKFSKNMIFGDLREFIYL